MRRRAHAVLARVGFVTVRRHREQPGARSAGLNNGEGNSLAACALTPGWRKEPSRGGEGAHGCFSTE